MTSKPVLVPQDAGKLTTDPDLNPPKKHKLLAIEWSRLKLTTDEEALAVWKQMAVTGEDWEAKLDEIPDEESPDNIFASPLARALLRGGNFTCVKPAAAPGKDCARKVPSDIEPPLPSATFDDPCLRRMLAMWAIAELQKTDAVIMVRQELEAIAAIPPPESQLVALALDAYPETEQDRLLQLRAIAHRAGHHELANNKISVLDIPHVIESVQKHHMHGGLEMLSAETHRAVFLGAIADVQMQGKARVQAMVEVVGTLDSKPGKDAAVQKALIAATKDKDCHVAAAAGRMLVKLGNKQYGAGRPRTKATPTMMRSLCVLASLEQQQGADEASYLLGYVPAAGLEVVRVKFDPYNDVDSDGDGDPHTERESTKVARDGVTLPELDDMVRAFAAGCTGTSCKSEEHEFRFGLKPGAGGDLMLSKVEVIDRPPCPK